MTFDDRKLIVAVIGEGKMAKDCIARMLRRSDVRVALLVTSKCEDNAAKRLSALCAKHDVTVMESANPNSDSVLQSLTEASVEVVFNINGFSILQQPLIDLPSKGVVNFHNGPLPAYAGLNIPTWVIWNGEQEHGVTWHYVDEKIDTGDVISQGWLEVDSRETAATLMFKCIIEGISLFDQVVEGIVEGKAPRKPQAGKRSYFRGRDIPNGGLIDFRWPVEKVDRLLRALDFHPLPNQLAYPQCCFNSFRIRVSDAEAVRDSTTPGFGGPGTIIQMDEDGIVVTCSDGKLVIRSFVAPDGAHMSINGAIEEYGLKIGARLA